ncbi:DUF3068 domain-containing protein [Arsenicicoccus sp. oral taxon 190]|uniref:DUF3068 domain-containing protein n=1 Tax=Arsenicicoccus sp. oral taxon 190 TaxID=1658671 RepID=UPI000679FD58|nr:DUF3068 domain-containing protein [Arsenicicoccus sp. oral taxon 190]AKT50761.1 hypothetical protein ADJ73_04570 [Arsenicicoccus sp. oral taxon 190]
MRRILGGLAVFLGVLALVLGLRADAVYHRLAKVKLDQSTTAVSEGTGVSVMRVWGDGKTVHFAPLTGQRVRNTRNVTGIPGKVPESQRDTQAFWQMGLKTEIVDVQPIAMTNEGVSLDRVSAMTTNCCGDYTSVGTLDEPGRTASSRHEGLFFKFPFDAQKRSYPFWDAELKGARDASYVRNETIQGVTTQVYEQQIPTTRLPGSQSVPRSMFVADAIGSVDASVDYANTRTFWVEPTTGVILKGQEQIERTLVSDAGRVTLVKGTIAYTDATQKALADEYAPKAKALAFVRDLLGPVGFVLGALLLALGLLLLFAHRRRARHQDLGHREDRELVGATATDRGDEATTTSHR